MWAGPLAGSNSAAHPLSVVESHLFMCLLASLKPLTTPSAKLLELQIELAKSELCSRTGLSRITAPTRKINLFVCKWMVRSREFLVCLMYFLSQMCNN